MTHPFVPCPNVARVEMVYQYQGVILENVFHVRSNAPFNATTLATLAGVFDTWDSSVWKAQRANICVLSKIHCKALDDASSPIYDLIVNPPNGRAGTAGTNAMPSNVTLAIKLATGLAGRSQRGRIYVPPFDRTALSSQINQVIVGTANTWATNINTLIANIVAANANWHLVVASFFNNGAWRSTCSCNNVINAVVADYNVDSQRRRLIGRGL